MRRESPLEYEIGYPPCRPIGPGARQLDSERAFIQPVKFSEKQRGGCLSLTLGGGRGLCCVGSYSDSDKPFLLRKCNISPGTEGTEPDFLTHHLSGLREQSSVFHKEKCRLKTSGDGLVGMRVATSHKWRRTQRQLQRGKHAVYEVWKKHMAFARISFGVSPPPTIHDSRECCTGRGGSQLCELSAFLPCQAGLCLPH